MAMFPGRVLKIIARYHRGGVSAKTCAKCPALCCSQGGFALLENVVLIYEKYRAGRLKRTDFTFEPGMEFGEFVFTYFDVWTRDIDGSKLVMFHMKCLGPDNNLVSIPEIGDYWETRSALFERNPWLSRGCVFLSRELPAWMEDDGGETRGCILHSPESAAHVTAKPVDCVFHTCVSRLRAKNPGQGVMEKWFRALSMCFPGSERRFKKMTEGK